ncbi:uncharacterized protein JCM6883_005332 [Sporobolomyces salmoneus]|uniref:uncharacterized protein n=1 Tax=Sporobolomyces salmoneus TaxID=183962 RepID=UPI0031799C66
MAQPSPTPSSEIIHLVSTFADTLDSLPPSLTRSLSDLKELDAVLSGSLQSITDKLKLLSEMMYTPPPGSTEAENEPKYTPLERLKLLREVTEDARTFQVGGEDKIRVATNTCESISTSTSHLATLSSLLLSFLPGHLLPQLPAPSAPHGYPASSTPASSLARRQLFDYPASRQAAQQAPNQRSAAASRDPYDVNRGRSSAASGKKRAQVDPYNGMMAADDFAYVPSGGGGGGGGGSSSSRKQQDNAFKDPSQRHPNQYTKKRAQAQTGSIGGSQGAAGFAGSGIGSSMTGAQGSSLYPPIPSHPLGMTAVDAVKEKRRGAAEPLAPAMSQNGNSSRAGSVVGGNGGSVYGAAGIASQDEYNLATLGGGSSQRAAAKRKQEEVAGASKRRKKGIDSPDPVARTLPGQIAATAKAPRRQASTILNEPPSPAQLLPLEDEFEALEGDDDADKTLYCFCQRVSFGEMIACDAPDCEHEWFHLPCVGLKSIPDGRWFCDECRRANPKSKKRR